MSVILVDECTDTAVRCHWGDHPADLVVTFTRSPEPRWGMCCPDWRKVVAGYIADGHRPDFTDAARKVLALEAGR